MDNPAFKEMANLRGLRGFFTRANAPHVTAGDSPFFISLRPRKITRKGPEEFYAAFLSLKKRSEFDRINALS
jgi:hypothetical protein